MTGGKEYLLGSLRIALGFIFFWSFLDKLFGLGFATVSEKSWISGGSPTLGYLSGATHGPFASIFQSIAGNPLVDWLFMLGLLGVGAAMILGIGTRVAAVAGSLMMLFIWISALPPKQNPFLDEHIVYILVFLITATFDSGQYLGLGNYWKKINLVKKYPILK